MMKISNFLPKTLFTIFCIVIGGAVHAQCPGPAPCTYNGPSNTDFERINSITAPATVECGVPFDIDVVIGQNAFVGDEQYVTVFADYDCDGVFDTSDNDFAVVTVPGQDLPLTVTFPGSALGVCNATVNFRAVLVFDSPVNDPCSENGLYGDFQDFTVTFEDTTPPSFTAPANQDLDCSSTAPTAPPEPPVTEFCDTSVPPTAPLTNTQISGDEDTGFTAVFTYGPVTDQCGNTAPAQTTTITTASCACPVTPDFIAPPSACSSGTINWSVGATCDVPGFPNEVVDFYTYAPGGVPGEAPPGYENSVDNMTPSFNLAANNPELSFIGFDFDCDNPPSITAVTNNTCSPVTITYIAAVYDHGANQYVGNCQVLRYDVVIYPAPLTVVETADGSNCGTPMVELRAANGDVCSSYSGIGTNGGGGSCVADSDALDYDFSNDPALTALAAAPAACQPTGLSGTIQCMDCCTPAATCNLGDINIEACEVPAPFTDPADVFTGIEACGATITMTVSDVGDTNVCGDGDGADFVRTYTLLYDGVVFTTCDQDVVVEDNTAPIFDPVCVLDPTFLTSGGNVCPADATISLAAGDQISVFEFRDACDRQVV
ncbi:MAG: GEVED domain-containing protein [Bacteroidota bacterium]